MGAVEDSHDHGATQWQLNGPTATVIQDDPQFDEAGHGGGHVESIHQVPDAHAREEINGGVSEEVPVNGPTGISEEDALTEDQENTS